MRISLALSSVALVATGCFLGRGIVNASPGLRWWLFSTYGAEKMCPEMLRRSAPLKLSADGNAIGRFFPERCSHQVNDSSQTVTITFGGTGYAWTPVAGRIGFLTEASVEYAPDFEMTDEAVYVYGKTTRIVDGPRFFVGSVENKLVDWAARSPVGYLASTFGSQIVSAELTSGFTVVHTDQGDDFALGMLRPPARPRHPVSTEGERYSFANETTEIHAGQLDFLGPVRIAEDQRLFLRMRLTGPAVDVWVVPRAVADPWREGLQRGAPLSLPAAPPSAAFVLQPGSEHANRIRLAAGEYVVVVDNSPLGATAPPWSPLAALGAGTAVIACSLEVGEE